MGMLINGQWTDKDQIIQQGTYVRQVSAYNQAISQEIIQTMRSEPKRFYLIASLSCPWSHRALVIRHMKGLENEIPLQIAGGQRIQGYPINGGQPWRVPGTHQTIVHLHQLYTLSDPAHSGRPTVPVLWDSKAQKIISNESKEIMKAFDQVPASPNQWDFTLFPREHTTKIEQWSHYLYENLTNAVYCAGFAEQQQAYEHAVDKVFQTLDQLEIKLSRTRYLIGSIITEADWQLFPTLLRFDAVYFILHRCSRRRLIDYPHLWAYARDLYAWGQIANTVHFDVIRKSSYENDTLNNPFKIVAVSPEANWSEPHHRDTLSPAQIELRSGQVITVKPPSFSPQKPLN